MNKADRRLLLTMFLTMTASCGEDPVAPSVGSVQITTSIDTLRSIGEVTTASATVLDLTGAAVTRSIQWSSSDPAVVTATGGGTITARDNGSAVVIAEVDGVADTVMVIVHQRVTAISIEAPDTVFSVGVRVRLGVTATDELGSPYTRTPVEWESDAVSVASVEPGLALPLSAGSAELTARADDLESQHSLAVVPEIELDVPQAVAESFQWAIEDMANQRGVVGTSAAIILPGVGTWRGVYGRSNPDEMLRSNMLFYPGSIQKAITSSLVLSLVDDGTLMLSDTIGQWLAFQNPNIPTGVTVRQLMDNTSGIFPYTSYLTLADSLFADGNRVWELQELAENFIDAPVFAPGTSWQSSNSGYLLASLVAEAATGETVAEAMRSRVFDAMGLTEAAIAFFETPANPVASTWRRDAAGALISSSDLQTVASHTLLGPQGLIGAGSLARFGEALFGDFLSPSLREDLLTSIPDNGASSFQVGSGIGVRQYNYLGRTQWGHSGSQSAGSGFLVWDEESGIVISLLYNQNAQSHTASHFTLMPELLSLALAALVP